MDEATGLLWQQGGSFESMTYERALAYVAQMNEKKLGGYNDWRLPTLEEAMSLMESKKRGELYLDSVFDGWQLWIWTSNIYSGSLVWVAYFIFGCCNDPRVDDDRVSVRLVR